MWKDVGNHLQLSGSDDPDPKRLKPVGVEGADGDGEPELSCQLRRRKRVQILVCSFDMHLGI